MASNSKETTETERNPTRISYIAESKKEIHCLPSASFEILNKYGSQLKRFRKRKENELNYETTCNSSNYQVLSAESLVKFARTRYVVLPSEKTGNFLPPKGSAKSHSNSCPRNVHCILFLRLRSFATDNLMMQKSCLEVAIKLLQAQVLHFKKLSHHFAETLQERIGMEMGRIDLERRKLNVEALMNMQPTSLAYEQELPICQVTQFTGIQVILDSVATARKIPLVDFGIKSGSHGTVLMHALADQKNCSLQLLKITAVGMLKDRLEELVEANEVVAVYFKLHLWSPLACPDSLESLIKAIKNLNPCVMVVIEVEANTNTSDFLGRFYVALYVFSATFDCLECCLERDNQFREVAEKEYHREMIQNIIISEDEERIVHNVKINFWRELFARFGIVETEFSQSCLCQASSLANSSGYSTLKMNGKCIILEWKGIPMLSLSAWKFQQTE
ncbi:hypothetical protein Pfo_015885 [Paulownia fortunei]|nr:hypothetical protein Pfo_015885 [Paulownia fortunei]